MRLALSVIALLLVAFVVLNLTKKQAEVLVAKPRATSGTASAPVSTLPQQVQQDVQKALEQGLQQRASAPGP